MLTAGALTNVKLLSRALSSNPLFEWTDQTCVIRPLAIAPGHITSMTVFEGSNNLHLAYLFVSKETKCLEEISNH